RQDSTGTAKLILDLANILEEADRNNVTQVEYTQAFSPYGNVVSQFRAVSKIHLFDGLGSTDRLTDGNGPTSVTYVYKAFGSIVASTGTSTNAYRFVGQLGYYFNADMVSYSLRARILDPTTGRFLTPDPIAIRATDPTMGSLQVRAIKHYASDVL